MKTFLLFFLFVGYFYNGKGQILESWVAKFTKENGIDRFLVYTRSLDGSFPLDSCHWEEPHYLFWQQHGQWFAKRFDYCQSFKAVPLDSISPLRFYLSNKDRIDKEEIKVPTYHQTVTRKGKRELLITTSTASHQPYHHFQLFTGTKSKTVEAGEYELEFKKFENGRKNIYYSKNQNTKLKSLVDITSNLIKSLNAEKKLVAE